MAKGFEIQGLNELLIKLNTIDHAIREDVNDEMKAGAIEMNNEAVKNIRSNNSIGISGGLFRDQQMVQVDDHTFEVVNSAPHAAFVEYGTGARANPPAEWAANASTFKGYRPPGAGNDFLMRIVAWVRAKGLSGRYSVKTRRRQGNKINREAEDMAIAYPIYRSILKNGAYSHPFLYPAFIKVGPKIVENVKKILNKAIQ